MIGKITARDRDALAKHRDWLEQAAATAHMPVSKDGSPHPSVQVGAVLVSDKGKKQAISSNRFASGVDRRRPERYENGSKSQWINCAEQMVLAQAARDGIATKGSRLYVTLEPCAICAGLIAEAGIREVFVPINAIRRYSKLKAKWKRSIEIGLVKLAEAGVKLTAIDAAVEKM